MKMFGVILVALWLSSGESLGRNPASRHGSFLKFWTTESESILGLTDPEFGMVSQVVFDAQHAHHKRLTRAQAEAYEQWKKDRRSKYDVPSGKKNLDDWCSGANVLDPACEANPAAMSIADEIEAVRKHMMCKRYPGKCKAPPAEKEEEGTGEDSEKVSGKKEPAKEATESDAGHASKDDLDKSLNQDDSKKAVGDATDSMNPEESSEKLTGLVKNLENLTETLEKEDKLDPELGKALGEMVNTGKAAADTLKKVAKIGPEEGDAELGKMIDEAEALDEAVFKFQTEVHPHGYKWWRYRWEYAFVEANILNLLVFTTMLLYAALHYVSDRMSMFDGTMEHENASVVQLYHKIVTRGMHELNVLGAIAFIIWALEECGVFLWIVKFLPAKTNPVNAVIELTGQGEDMAHWPTTDHHVIFALRSVNCHLFLAMLLYYLLMYHITLGAVAILEQFMKHENSEFYQRFLEDGVHSEDLKNKDKEIEKSAGAVHRVLKNKGPLGKALSSEYLISLVFGHFTKPEDFDNFKEYIAKHVQYHEGFQELHDLIPVVPIYPYLVQKLHLSLNSMICIDWRVWLLVQAVLVIQALIHYFMHIAVVELIPFNLLVGSIILAFQFVWTRRRAAYVVDPANQVSSEAEGRSQTELQARENQEQWLLWLEQLTLFFLCFSAARLFFSSFFWSDYFRLSCCLFVLFLSAYMVFAFIGALAIPMFIIMMAVPPHVTKQDGELMKKVLEQHENSGVRSESVSEAASSLKNGGKGKMKRCDTRLAII